jgi:hypothetical protein
MKNPRSTYGPYALITGASSGIGAEFARQLAKAGLDLVLVGRRRERLESIAAELHQQFQTRVEMVELDLMDEGAVEELAGRTEPSTLGWSYSPPASSRAGRSRATRCLPRPSSSPSTPSDQCSSPTVEARLRLVTKAMAGVDGSGAITPATSHRPRRRHLTSELPRCGSSVEHVPDKRAERLLPSDRTSRIKQRSLLPMVTPRLISSPTPLTPARPA